MKLHIIIVLAAVLLSLGGCRNNTSPGKPSRQTDSLPKPHSSIGGMLPGQDTFPAIGADAKEKVFNPDRPFAFETGVVEYKYSGGRSGTQKIFIANYGRRQRIENNYVRNNSLDVQPVDEVYISTPEEIYYFDNRTKSGYRLPSKSKEVKANMLADIARFGIDSTMRKHGYRRSGNLMISGKDCQVYKGKASEFCFHEGLNIRTEMALSEGDKYVLEAVSIRKGELVDDKLFAPPGNAPLPSYEDYVKRNTKGKL